jgi:hypothetical protein
MTAYILTVGNEHTSNPKTVPGFGAFAEFLQAVDQTGLGAKRYDFILKWTPDGQPAGDAADAPVTQGRQRTTGFRAAVTSSTLVVRVMCGAFKTVSGSKSTSPAIAIIASTN